MACPTPTAKDKLLAGNYNRGWGGRPVAGRGRPLAAGITRPARRRCYPARMSSGDTLTRDRKRGGWGPHERPAGPGAWRHAPASADAGVPALGGPGAVLGPGGQQPLGPAP